MSTNATNAVGVREASSAWRGRERASYWAVQVGPFVLALVAYFAAFQAMRPGATGDEPHYLMAAQSVYHDGDLDLRNDYASPERTAVAVETFPLDRYGHAADYTGSGQLRPIRGIGLSTLISPAVGLGGLTGVRLLMLFIAALLADQLFRLLRDLGFRRRYAFLAWAAVAFCYPMLVFSSQIYPELPGALLILVALRVMVRWASTPVALVLGSTAAALLVWLHVRFIPLSAGVFLGLVIAACRAHRRGPADPRAPGVRGVVRAGRDELARAAGVLTREWRSVTVPLAVPYLAGLALFAAVSNYLYGSLHPMAPYRQFSDTTAGSGGASFLYDFALADLFNPIYGWIPYVPVHWLGLAALGCLVLRWRWLAAACIAVPLGYELVVASAGVAVGWALPARYLIPFILFIAVPLALVIEKVRPALVAFVPLLGVSLVFAAAAVQQHHHLYPASDRPRLFGVRTAASLFPITNPHELATSYTMRPGTFGPNTGRLEGEHAVAEPGDPSGPLLYGPYQVLARGSYRATYELAVEGARPTQRVVMIDAASAPPPKLLARRYLFAGEFTPGRMNEVTLEFDNVDGGLIETRVYYQGVGTVRAGEVRVEPLETRSDVPSGRLPDWPKALAWVLGTILAGWLLVIGMRRAQRDDASSSSRADA